MPARAAPTPTLVRALTRSTVVLPTAVLLTALAVTALAVTALAVAAPAGTGPAGTGRPAARTASRTERLTARLVAATAATPASADRHSAGPTPTPTGAGGGARVGAPVPGPALPTPALPSSSSPGGPAGLVGAAGSGGCGVLNVTGCVTAAINSWLRGLVTGALAPLLGLLARSVLTSPNVTGASVRAIWQLTAGIADSLLVLLGIAGGLLVMTHGSLQSRYTARDVAPRLLLAALAVNLSLPAVSTTITVVNALTVGLLGTAPALAAGRALAALTSSALSGGGMLLVVLGLAVVVLLVVLLITFLVRVAVLVLLAAGGPLLLIWHALPGTEPLARTWWRALAGCAGVQAGQALLLVVALRVFLTATPGALFGGGGGGLTGLLVVIALLYLAVRLPGQVLRMVTRRGPGTFSRSVSYYLTGRAAGFLPAPGRAGSSAGRGQR